MMEILSPAPSGKPVVEMGKYGLLKTAIASLAMPFYHNSLTFVFFIPGLNFLFWNILFLARKGSTNEMC